MKMKALPPETNCRNKVWQSLKVIPGFIDCRGVTMAVALIEISPNQLKAGMRAGGHPRSFRGSSTAGMVSMAVDSCETTSALLLIKTWYKASLRSFNFNV